jgi:hypothetical protein
MQRQATIMAVFLVTASGALATAATTNGLAARYPDDIGIEKDPAVLFADDFESGALRKWDQVRGGASVTEDRPNGGRWCARMTMERGRNTGGDAIKWFLPGADTQGEFKKH